MNDKQIAELDFWRNLIKSEGKEGFIRRRRADFYRHMNNFNGWADLDGYGLEVGAGCLSMVGLCAGEFDEYYGFIPKCIDPLSNEYLPILKEYRLGTLNCEYGDGESLDDRSNQFHWVINWNVIDHTPNPQKMADEMYRVLKRSGKLYFEVNFDDELAKPHYSLWNEAKVNEVLSKFKLLYKKIIRNEADKQTLYYGVYEKV